MTNIAKRILSIEEENLIKMIHSIRLNYFQNRFIFIEGDKMEEILQFLGATSQDLQKLKSSGNSLPQDPTLLFRKSRNGRFLINLKKQTISRLAFQPFVLSEEEDFCRSDSGMLRYFRGIEDNTQNNSAFQALIKFKSFMISDFPIENRLNLHDSFDKWVSTIFQLRTITSTELIGEPAQEGVHSDGVEHTMTTFINSTNMSKDSAISKIHTNEQKTGVHWADVDNKFVLGKVRHQHFLDTLFIVDSELKHSVSHLKCVDKSQAAIRDMIILFTRRPKNEYHSTFKYDSLNLHLEIPLEFPMITNNFQSQAFNIKNNLWKT